ncbi:PREDICTED: uncharacterized protein LOC101291777 [Fragaria vesca subsp. vesca]|uniref:uncharacterized protein LOC101291777 n=1 Tax=Fragaria vesca subsp. vesca TaxID=101020 RepID=UPI0002C2E4AF|nr:PREDICTED: uncharacterized protein LOC101291777 [Fragaria vesca subsp. vesca]
MAANPTNPSQNTSQFIKLSETNYLKWTRQIRSYLNGAGLWSYVDGSIPAPSLTTETTATETVPAKTIPNPEYVKWFTTDQQIFNIMITSLTDSVSDLTVGYDTSKEVWDCLARHFFQKSNASASSLKLQLLEL